MISDVNSYQEDESLRVQLEVWLIKVVMAVFDFFFFETDVSGNCSDLELDVNPSGGVSYTWYIYKPQSQGRGY